MLFRLSRALRVGGREFHHIIYSASQYILHTSQRHNVRWVESDTSVSQIYPVTVPSSARISARRGPQRLQRVAVPMSAFRYARHYHQREPCAHLPVDSHNTGETKPLHSPLYLP